MNHTNSALHDLTARSDISESMQAHIAKFADKKSAAEGLQGFLADLKQSNNDKLFILESLEHIPLIMELSADKQAAVAAAAKDLALAIFDAVEEWGLSGSVCHLEKSLGGKAKPASKELALKILHRLSERCPRAIPFELPWLVPRLCLLMNDSNPGVRKATKVSLLALCDCCGNKDLIGTEETTAFIPTIVRATESLNEVNACVEKLASCVFVQNVAAPHLAVIQPILWRGLNSRSEVTQRRCCVIVDNMCKLVDDPREAAPLFPEILPLVRRKADETSDKSAREMAEKTLATLEKLQSHGPKPELNLREVASEYGEFPAISPAVEKYYQNVTYALSKANCYETDAWQQILAPSFNADVAAKVMNVMSTADAKEEEEFIDDDATAPDLYKGTFTLAFGTLTLLRETKLHLKKNKFYGLIGPTNCGKTTMMRAIAEQRVEGFPKRDELTTIFVSATIEERHIEGPSEEFPIGKSNLDLNGIEFCVDTVNNLYKKEPPISYEDAERELGEIGFKNEPKGVNLKSYADMRNYVVNYSGGWKVKMQLACAMLMNADILMFDEPTAHLDSSNVAWVKDWLSKFPGSVIAASKNPAFLNDMCTHLIDFGDKKLIQFKAEKGEVLTKYCELHPEKSTFFEISSKNLKFVFPNPGPLEGVKSRGRQILKMHSVSFRYDKAKPFTVEDITLAVCMASRISVVGNNGAGKSTAIKLLIGEITPELGTIYRHPGSRLAYLSQHTFHHLQNHFEKTPADYILWRFAGNDDRESIENQAKVVHKDDAELREVPWCVDSVSGHVRKCVPGEKRDIPVVPDCIYNRRKNKARKYEYEVKWMYKPAENTVWVERETMLDMGYEKLVCREDEKQATMAGLMAKPLTKPSVENALKDFGLDSETVLHNPLGSLSDGQKVKVVLAAAMWQNPHILILDEPTNYLDRDGLGALAAGIEKYEGGVVVISHDQEFADRVSHQKWIMKSGHLKEVGALRLDEEEGDAGAKQIGPETITDQYGNEVAVNKEVTMTAKELKKVIKELEAKLKENRKKKHLSEAEEWDIQDKIEEAKSRLGA